MTKLLTTLLSLLSSAFRGCFLENRIRLIYFIPTFLKVLECEKKPHNFLPIGKKKFGIILGYFTIMNVAFHLYGVGYEIVVEVAKS